MRILMVYPQFPDTFWSFKHALPFIRKKASFPPLGLLTVAALLPEDWEKRLVDMNTTQLTTRDLQWADYVFVSAMIAQRESVRTVLQRCKQAGTKVVAGGPLFMSEHEDFSEVDHFVLNEAELTLPPFISDLERGKPRRIYATSEFADLALSPMPMWDLADMGQYASMCIQYSRGCPFNCEFCNVTAMLGHRFRTKSADQIVAELDALYSRGWHGGVFFVDDNFIGSRRKLKEELLPALIAWRRDKRTIGFQTEASIDLVDDPELLGLMVKAGFDKVFVGIETPNDESLAECKKSQNRGRDLMESVKIMQRAGLEVQGGFIVGFDHDTPSIFRRQIEFIQQSGIVTAMVGLLQAPKGTRLYERLKREGRLTSETSGNNTDDTMNFRPKMDPKVLHEGYRRILLQLYSPRAYYERIRTFLREYKSSHVIRPHVSWHYIAAFLRSMLILGVRGKERLEYWKLFFWTLFRKPHLFPLAITLAIYGFHFRRVSERYAL